MVVKHRALSSLSPSFILRSVALESSSIAPSVSIVSHNTREEETKGGNCLVGGGGRIVYPHFSLETLDREVFGLMIIFF